MQLWPQKRMSTNISTAVITLPGGNLWRWLLTYSSHHEWGLFSSRNVMLISSKHDLPLQSKILKKWKHTTCRLTKTPFANDFNHNINSNMTRLRTDRLQPRPKQIKSVNSSSEHLARHFPHGNIADSSPRLLTLSLSLSHSLPSSHVICSLIRSTLSIYNVQLC